MDAKNFVSEFQYIGSSVRHLSLNNSFVCINLEDDLENQIDVDYSLGEIQESEDGNLYGTIDLFTIVNVSNNTHSLSIELDLQGCFCSPASIGIDEFSSMISLNGCVTLYSMSRSMIASITSQSLTGGNIILPMINMFKLREQKESE